MTTILETEHLVFRPLAQTDIDNLAQLYADPEVMRYVGGPRGRDEAQRILNGYIREYQLSGHSFFATVSKEDGQFIGNCGLLHQEVEEQQEIELAYLLARPYWQHGLAIEGIQALRDYGLQKLGFPRLISLIPPAHEAAISIAEKIGMRYTREVNQWGQKLRLYTITQADLASGNSA